MSMVGNRSSVGPGAPVHVNGSRASDEDGGKTSVKVGTFKYYGNRLSNRSKSNRHSFHVAIRIRPPLKPSDPGFELIPQRFQKPIVQLTSPTSLTIDSPQGRKLFVFDRVFGEDVDQEGIWDYLTDSINHFVQGYNVSMLAYGQSGAGKSYTMGTSGPAEQGDAEIMGKRFHHLATPGSLFACFVLPRADILLLQVSFHELRQPCLRNSMAADLPVIETQCLVYERQLDIP